MPLVLARATDDTVITPVDARDYTVMTSVDARDYTVITSVDSVEKQLPSRG